ncbi:SDR family NAD(P)-dependent oxidoreductase, partial [Bordetella avium]
ALVHCAGLVRTGGARDTRPQDTELLWRLHGAAPMALVQALAPQLPDRRGRILLVSSRAVLGRAQRLAYAATKSAQIGLARSLAAELVGRGITVNVIAPGAVDTPMLNDPKRGAAPSLDLPLGRLITAREVAATLAFFLSDEAGAITGQTLYVCGGASLGAMTP